MKPLTYYERNGILLSMGFPTYAQYQESVLWLGIRLQVLKSAGFKCVLCGEPANQVHHSQYTHKNLSGVELEHLHAICDSCHCAIEFDSKGNKLTTEQALRKFNKLCGKAKRDKSSWRQRHSIGYLTGMAHKKFHTTRRKGK